MGWPVLGANDGHKPERIMTTPLDDLHAAIDAAYATTIAAEERTLAALATLVTVTRRAAAVYALDAALDARSAIAALDALTTD